MTTLVVSFHLESGTTEVVTTIFSHLALPRGEGAEGGVRGTERLALRRKTMFGAKLKLDEDLIQRCKQHAEELGYSSVEEFITHVLERELKGSKKQSEEDEEEVARRLKGLGYIE